MQCILEISLKKIKSNWEKINKYSNFKASAVVKANAYGFGLEEIAIALNQSGCKYFYVAQIEEGIKLRNKPVFSVQYHPESNPGPQDSHYLFSDFIKDVKKYAKKKRH